MRNLTLEHAESVFLCPSLRESLWLRDPGYNTRPGSPGTGLGLTHHTGSLIISKTDQTLNFTAVSGFMGQLKTLHLKGAATGSLVLEPKAAICGCAFQAGIK